MFLVATAVLLPDCRSATPGLPFTEDFSDNNLQDVASSTARWSTEEACLVMAWKRARFAVFAPATTSGSDITGDSHFTQGLALGDLDGDGDLDLVAGNYQERSRVYMNTGLSDPWGGVSGVDVSAATHTTNGVSLGDVDGDGDLDIVIATQSASNHLYLNDGSGLSWSVGDISSVTEVCNTIALGDINNDGHLDLVPGNKPGVNSVYLNNGTSSPFAGVTPLEISADAHQTADLALGDVNGDGNLDVVAGNSNAVNRLYLGNGDGTFQPGTDVTSDVDQTAGVALGDMDADGDLDLVVGNAGNPGVANRLYLNDGLGDPFDTVIGSNVTSDADNTDDIAVADLDGDGDLDVIAGNHRDNGFSYGKTNRFYLNNGTADPFAGSSGADITSATSFTHVVALGDVDNDGDVDLVTGNTGLSGEVNRLYLNNATRNPWNSVSWSDVTSDLHETQDIALADVDNDGDLDVIACNYSEPNRLYLNNGSGVFGAGSDITSDAVPREAVTLGDVDNDGDLDLVVGNNGQANRLYLNNGGSFSAGTDITGDMYNTNDVALGDIDNDGDLDLVAGNVFNQTNRLYLNNGGTFGAGSDITPDGQQTYAIALGDVDGDGDLDIVAGNNGTTNRLYLNSGGTFSSGSDITADAQDTHDLALGDVDNDGDLDLVAVNYGTPGENNRLYLNNGTADPWSGVTGIDISPGGTVCMALSDVDGDGDLDFLAGNPGGTPSWLYLNNGTEDPWSDAVAIEIAPGSGRAQGMALGDLDSDGDLDLVIGRHTVPNVPNRVFLSTAADGGGLHPWNTNTLVASDITSDASYTYEVRLGDVDGDGDLDLVAGNYGPGERNRVYLNNGTDDPWNGVTGKDITSDALITTSIALGDVDSDGDLDLVTGNLNRNRLYLNNGTADPWNGVAGSDITTDAHDTTSVALLDVDTDGDLDLVVGNLDQPNRLYLNNGTSDPWNGVSGTDITSGTYATACVVLGDVDTDGDLDLVTGNHSILQNDRLYLNNGTGDPWSGASGSNITSDAFYAVESVLGDVDNDGDLDLTVANQYATARLYQNNHTSDPWGGVSGSDITAVAHNLAGCGLADVDGDGDLDFSTADQNDQPNWLFLNNGTSNPWNGVSGISITSDAHNSRNPVFGDLDRDGRLDIVVGNVNTPHRFYRHIRTYQTLQSRVQSLEIDTETANIQGANLVASATTPPNTWIDYYLSNNGGANWFKVRSGSDLVFSTVGSDLRWRAELHSLSPVLSAQLYQVSVSQVMATPTPSPTTPGTPIPTSTPGGWPTPTPTPAIATIEEVAYLDVDFSDSVNQGDSVVLIFNKKIGTVQENGVPGSFYLPVASDSLGAGATMELSTFNTRQVIIHLGTSPQLTIPGVFSTSATSPGSPSGIDIAASMSGAILDIDGTEVEDGGVVNVDDTASDQVYAVEEKTTLVSASTGGTVDPGPNGFYTGHRISIPPGSLSGDTTFTLRSAGTDNLTAVSLSPASAVVGPVTVTVPYKEDIDIDWALGYVEQGMRLRNETTGQIFAKAADILAWDQIIDIAANTVTVTDIPPDASAPDLQWGNVGIPTVEGSSGSGGPEKKPQQGPFTLQVGPNGLYTKHRISVPGYVEPGGTIFSLDQVPGEERHGYGYDSLTGAYIHHALLEVTVTGDPFDADTILTLEYKDLDNLNWNDLPDGAEEDVMQIYAWNPAGASWIELSQPQTVDTLSNTVTVTVPDITRYQIYSVQPGSPEATGIDANWRVYH